MLQENGGSVPGSAKPRSRPEPELFRRFCCGGQNVNPVPETRCQSSYPPIIKSIGVVAARGSVIRRHGVAVAPDLAREYSWRSYYGRIRLGALRGSILAGHVATR